SRLKAICARYRLLEYFDLIERASNRKSEEEWVRVFRAGQQRVFESFGANSVKTYVIGDLLEYDIRPGNSLAAVTIYKPGGFRGNEVPQDAGDTPSHTIAVLAEVIDLLP